MAVYTDGVHLIADTLEELHAFAASIGLNRCWFENHRKQHYDLMLGKDYRAKKLKLALEKGAILKTDRELITIIQQQKRMNNQSLEGLKIVEAAVENFKNIEKKMVRLDGQSFLIFGGNKKGKSSFIQALLSPLDSSFIPSQPIKEGEERSTVSVKLAGNVGGELKEYTLDLYFTPKNQSGRLVITDETGEVKKSARTFIKSLIGNIGFDIFTFLKSSPAKQIQELRKFLSIDEDKAFEALTQEINATIERKSYLLKKAEEDQAVLGQHGYTDQELELYVEVKDTTALREQLKSIGPALEDWIKVENGIAARTKSLEEIPELIKQSEARVETIKSDIQRIDEEIAELHRKRQHKMDVEWFNENVLQSKLQEQAETMKTEIAAGEKWIKDKGDKPNAEAIQQQIEEIETHNRHVESIKKYAERAQSIHKTKQEAELKDQEVSALKDKRAKIIEASRIPVKGLTFTDKEVLYKMPDAEKPLPLEENQINKATLIEIGVQIAMALNERLRVIVISDGSLLDKDTLKSIVDVTTAKGYQLIVEVVEFDNKGELEIKFAEEALS